MERKRGEIKEKFVLLVGCMVKGSILVFRTLGLPVFLNTKVVTKGF